MGRLDDVMTELDKDLAEAEAGLAEARILIKFLHDSGESDRGLEREIKTAEAKLLKMKEAQATMIASL